VLCSKDFEDSISQHSDNEEARSRRLEESHISEVEYDDDEPERVQAKVFSFAGK
jgi:hypothetical protein